MNDTFTIEFTGDPEVLFARAQSVATQRGALFEGDSTSGTFFGQGVSGSYQREGQQLVVTVSNKPLFVPWILIENRIRSFFTTDPCQECNGSGQVRIGMSEGLGQTVTCPECHGTGRKTDQ